MKAIPIIATLAILPLSAHAAGGFSPPSTSYKLRATFHITANGVTSKCFAQLHGKTTYNGLLRIDGYDSKCLRMGTPMTAHPTGPGTGFVALAFYYGSTLCGAGSNFTVSQTGRLEMPPLSNGACTFSATGQFSPVITIVP